MSELDAALGRLSGHPGVEQLILLGRDGLVIRQLRGAGTEESIAARVPTLAGACEALGAVAARGPFATAVVEFDAGVFIVSALSGDLLLALVVAPDVGFAPLLRELRRERKRLIELL